MVRFLFLLGLIPVVIGVAFRQWFGERVLKRLPRNSTQLTAEEFLNRLTSQAKLAMTVSSAKRTRVTEKEFILSTQVAEAKKVISLAEVGLLFGLALLGQRQPELLRWRAWALKFSWAFPAYLLLVVIFSVAVGSFVRWALPAVSLGVGIGTVVAFLVVWVEWQAAGLASEFLRARAIVAREDDRRAISLAMKALAASKAVPGVLRFLFPSSKDD